MYVKKIGGGGGGFLKTSKLEIIMLGHAWDVYFKLRIYVILSKLYSYVTHYKYVVHYIDT